MERTYTIPSLDEHYEPSSDEDIEAAEIWHVKRLENSKKQKRVKYKNSDQTKILVDLYDSDIGFLEEYENFLSETVLLDRNFDKNRELAAIELLKQRFGESAMLRCDVIF